MSEEVERLPTFLVWLKGSKEGDDMQIVVRGRGRSAGHAIAQRWARQNHNWQHPRIHQSMELLVKPSTSLQDVANDINLIQEGLVQPVTEEDVRQKQEATA